VTIARSDRIMSQANPIHILNNVCRQSVACQYFCGKWLKAFCLAKVRVGCTQYLQVLPSLKAECCICSAPLPALCSKLESQTGETISHPCTSFPVNKHQACIFPVSSTMLIQGSGICTESSKKGPFRRPRQEDDININ
jgi:hypothetical protein